jgi:hypothetical protein
MPQRWARIAKNKLRKINNALASANILGPKSRTELSGKHKDTTWHNKKGTERLNK